ncbi:hypothetical protein ABW20_dc0107986 [Dactylellina cionopaga]|nr:hypothetical protein ABW20_dc0107986 [Dactylellina cionopaga]
MDRLLRRKPLPRPKVNTRSNSLPASTSQEIQQPMTNGWSYYENVEKSPELDSAAAQTIRSLENTYNRRSVTSYPPKFRLQTDTKQEQNQSRQEHAHAGSRSASYSSETAASHPIATFTSESGSIRTLVDSPRDTYHESYEFDGKDPFRNPSQYFPEDDYVRDHSRGPRSTSKGRNSQRYSTPRQSYVTSEEPNQLALSLRDKTPKKRSTATSGDDDDDDELSSVCSEDSYLEEERSKYYKGKMMAAVDAENWKEAKDYAKKLAEIMESRSDINLNEYLSYANIHYMLCEFKEAQDWLARIPRKKSTDPDTLVNALNFESAIAFRTQKYDAAFSLSKKSAKYARKFELSAEMDAALYLSWIICVHKGDTSEANFYKQMIGEEYAVPLFLAVLKSKTDETTGLDEAGTPLKKIPAQPRVP